jgi:hypothetical protein
MTFSETFVCTPFPESVNGEELTLAVLVSPRLSNDVPAALKNWPDARDWPAIAPTWTVTITQGAVTKQLTATEVIATPYDQASWHNLFPDDQQVTPYVPGSPSTLPIRSFPNKMIRDATKNFHVGVMQSSRTGPSDISLLFDDDTFSAALAAADPAKAKAVANLQAGTPPTANTISLEDAFAMVELFHASSAPAAPIPIVTGVSLNTGDGAAVPLKINGLNFTGATAVYFTAPVIAATDVKVVNDTEITCITPTLSDGHYDVRVVTPNGTSDVSPQDVYDVQGAQ